jgi:hypothetical protein
MSKPNTDPLMEPRRKQSAPAERDDGHRRERKRPRQVDTLADTAPFNLPRRPKEITARHAKPDADD